MVNKEGVIIAKNTPNRKKTIRIKLTKRLIDSTPSPTTGQVFLRDTELQGLSLRLTPGLKTFVIEKFIKGRSRRMKIGVYGVFTVEDARKRAKELMGDIAKGEDPFQDKVSRRHGPTFGDLKEYYLNDHAARKKIKSVKDDTNKINKYLRPWFNRKLTDIDQKDVYNLHSEIGITAPIQANRVIELVRRMFNTARKRKMFDGVNPVTDIDWFPEQERDRFVQPDELPRLMQALAQEVNPYVRGALVVSLFTGARIGEVRTMKWHEVDLGQGIWRLPETKAGRPHIIPLPKHVIKLLQSLPLMAGNSCVFPGKHRDGHIGSLASAWDRIKKQADLEDVRIHDLRRTLGSWMAGAGESLVMIGKILNHSTPSVTQVYARLALDPVRQALEANSQRMLAVAGNILEGADNER